MKKLVLASAAAVGLLGLAACSDSADNTTTQSTPPPATDSTTPNAAPAPETGTGGETQGTPPAQPAPAPAQ